MSGEEYGSTKRKVNADFLVEVCANWSIVHRIWPDGSTTEVLVASSRAEAHSFAGEAHRDLQRKREDFDFSDDQKRDVELRASVYDTGFSRRRHGR